MEDAVTLGDADKLAVTEGVADTEAVTLGEVEAVAVAEALAPRGQVTWSRVAGAVALSWSVPSEVSDHVKSPRLQLRTIVNNRKLVPGWKTVGCPWSWGPGDM